MRVCKCTGVKYMKHYNDEDLDSKINSFLNRKLEKYPEITMTHLDETALSRRNLTMRMIHSLTSRTILSSN